MTQEAHNSPEARRRLARAHARLGREIARISPGSYPFEVAKRVFSGVWADGFTHAGNLAFLALMTVFPFFIVIAGLAQWLGRTEAGLQAVSGFMRTVPPGVAEVLVGPIESVLSARSGWLLIFGVLVGLWTTASFIETLRDILRKAYGTPYGRPFYEYRLYSMLITIGAVLLALTAFAAQIVITAAEAFIYRLLPFLSDYGSLISASRVVPALLMFGAFYLIFYWLTPHIYRKRRYPKWPGAAFVTLWWISTTSLLPDALAMLGGYDLTYGSLAGVMIVLMFFFVVGIGVVIAAQLNAALVNVELEELQAVGLAVEHEQEDG
ncbi:MAG: YihY/virulence factor BrkB family protein [Sphingomonadaceae bacterium]|nr:YihY/virulence factor BrkB family protein [Sphingomonadaceae bacterium]